MKKIYFQTNIFKLHNQLKLMLFLIGFMSISPSVFSHGTVVWPASRIYKCYQNASNPNSVCKPCGNAVYNWMGVLQPNTEGGNHRKFVPDGQIASGGNGGGNFSCLNALSSKWGTTKVNHGYINLKWHNTAPHKTQYYKVYITPLDWDPTQPLVWDELIEIGSLGKGEAQKFTLITSKIPDSYAGKRAAIVSVWQRDYSHSHEAFYSVSDVMVSHTKSEANSPDSDPNSDADHDHGDHDHDHDHGDDGNGDHDGGNDDDNGGNDEGNHDDGDHTGGEINDTYDCSTSSVWHNNTVYRKNDYVVFSGILYKAKWWTRGKKPSEFSGADHQVWKHIKVCANNNDGTQEGDTDENNNDQDNNDHEDNHSSNCSNIGGWHHNKVYWKNDHVVFSGVLYQAKWWAKGRNPSKFSGVDQVWKSMGKCSKNTKISLNTSNDVFSIVKNVPNPCVDNTSLHYQVNEKRKLTLTIQTVSNQVIQEVFSNEVKLPGIYIQSIKLNAVKPGIYIGVLEDENGVIKTAKISVKK